MTVSAIFCSDLHFWHKPPSARSGEDWYKVQKFYIDQLTELKNRYDAPIIVAGDIFDKWNPPPELINFLLDNLPTCYAIPGQHDLPFHDYQNIEKSAYWTLVRSGKIVNIWPEEPLGVGNLVLHGFPFGFPVKPVKKRHSLCLHVAVVHSYIWKKGKGHPNASLETTVAKYKEKLDSYDASFFGDNHQGFLLVKDALMNCGTFIRRKSDEKEYNPMVGLLLEERAIRPHYLDTSIDKKFLEDKTVEKEENKFNIEGLLKEISDLENSSIDFKEALERVVVGVPKAIRNIIYGAIENV